MGSLPPFRADMVGSLLRTAPLKEARARRQTGEISAEALRRVEDAEISKIIARQQAVGLQSATDGEFRRAWWHFDFLEGLQGVEGYETAQGIQFQGTQTKPRSVRVTGKLGFAGHPMLDHFRFLAANTKLVAKMTIPSPSVLHFRGGRQAIDADVYPEMESYFAHLFELLDEVDFHKGKDPAIVTQRLRRLFLRAQPDARELRILRGILSDVQRLLHR